VSNPPRMPLCPQATGGEHFPPAKCQPVPLNERTSHATAACRGTMTGTNALEFHASIMPSTATGRGRRLFHGWSGSTRPGTREATFVELPNVTLSKKWHSSSGVNARGQVLARRIHETQYQVRQQSVHASCSSCAQMRRSMPAKFLDHNGDLEHAASSAFAPNEFGVTNGGPLSFRIFTHGPQYFSFLRNIRDSGKF